MVFFCIYVVYMSDTKAASSGREWTLSLTCGTKSNKGLSMLSQDVLGGREDPQLGQEVLNEIMWCYWSQVPLQFAQNQQLHLLWIGQEESKPHVPHEATVRLNVIDCVLERQPQGVAMLRIKILNNWKTLAIS